MRTILLTLILLLVPCFAKAEPFEIKEGDRVLFLGDTLLEREGNFGYLETRMHEQFPDRNFIVRNLAFSADTPLGWSRASFDPPAKGFERLKQQIALVKPTVVFLGYGMAASLQEMTDRSQDWTLNRDAARYGAEPMSAARFKKELGQLMDAITKSAGTAASGGAVNGERRASGSAGAPPAVSGAPAGNIPANGTAARSGESGDVRAGNESSAGAPKTAGGAPALPIASASTVRFVMLSPIRHEDLRKTRPGLPDPTEHNKLLEQYSKAIEELAKERGARFVDLAVISTATWSPKRGDLTDNGIHLSEDGYRFAVDRNFVTAMAWGGTVWSMAYSERVIKARELTRTNTLEARKNLEQESFAAMEEYSAKHNALRAAIIRKNELFFHCWRPANDTYIFGFRKGEQGRNAVEIPRFDPLIAEMEAEIERLKKSPTAPGTNAQKPPAPVPNPPPVASPQSPLPPPAFNVAPGLEISLWAETPLLAKPNGINWDAQGRLWTTSCALYPQIAPGQVANDKIIVVEDTNNDGKADKSTVFADGLLIPTGVAPVLTPEGRWACYVGQSTELLYFEDTNGDGKADRKRIVFGGFGTEDTHHTIHTLRWGPDGRLYFSQSIYIHSHMETPWGVVRLNSGGVCAYDPRTERVEVFARGLVNSWGHAWDKWGQSFLTDGAGGNGISWAFPGAIFSPHEGSRKQMPSVSPGAHPKFCGLEIIHSPHFPADWQGTAVTCDFRAHKIVHFNIMDRGAGGQHSGYVTQGRPVLVQTGDASFRPVDVKLGPDGAIYIADWTNPIINHGEVDFRDPRRDHVNGRIWRLSMKGGTPVKWESLVGRKVSQLVEALASTNSWESANAQRILIQKAGPQTAEMWGAEISKDTTGVRPALVSALTGKNDVVTAAVWGVARAINFDYYHEGSRGSMFQSSALGEDTKDERSLALAARRIGEWLTRSAFNMDSDCESVGSRSVLIDDILPELSRNKSPRVRVEAMRALGRMPSAKNTSLILDAAVNAPKGDPYYDFAAWLSINDVGAVWVDALVSGKWKTEGKDKQIQFATAALPPELANKARAYLLANRPSNADGQWIDLAGKAGNPAELRKVYDHLTGPQRPDTKVAERAIAALNEAARLRGMVPEGDLSKMEAFAASADESLVPGALHLLGVWKRRESLPFLLKRIAPGTKNEIAKAAFRALRDLGGKEVLDAVEPLIAANQPPQTRREAVVTLAALAPDRAIPPALAILTSSTNESETMTFWRDLLACKGFAGIIAAKLPNDLPVSVVTTGLRAVRELGDDGDSLFDRLEAIAGKNAASIIPSDYADLVARTKKDGDPVSGEALYRRAAAACTTCHAIGGAGGKLGPDMTSIGASAPLDYIIESVLNPAAKVKEGYHAFSFALKDGGEAVGIPLRETAEEQFIRTAVGETGIPKIKIVSKKLASGGASLMPSGLTAPWTDRERLHLYAFLGELGRPGPFDASKNNVARVWQISDSARTDGALKPDERQQTTPAYTLVDGRLTKELLAEKLAQLQPKNETVHLAARLQAVANGKVTINLSGVRKAWLDGLPLAVASEPSPRVDVNTGIHTLTVELETKSLPEVLKAESPTVTFLGD